MTQYDLSNNIYSFEELLINNKDLCAVEYDDDQDKESKIPQVQKKVKGKLKIKIKKFL